MAAEIAVRDTQGAETGRVTLDESFFGIEPNVSVLHQVVTAQLAAARSGTQSTKTRAEVSGGGKKPFKQKGTGRARQGSERAPQFTGGGVALGPKPRSYRQRTPKKMVQLALRSALSDRASEGRVAVVAPWPWSPPSTRDARLALAALGFEGRVMVVLARDDEEAYKSFRNLPDVQIVRAGELNAYDVLVNKWIVFTTETLPGDHGEATQVAATPSTATPSTATPSTATPSTATPSPSPSPSPSTVEVASAPPAEPTEEATP